MFRSRWAFEPTRRAIRLGFAAAAALAVVVCAGCRSNAAPTGFSLDRASKHVRMLGTAFGSRPAGTHANGLAREYVAGELRAAGFDVRFQPGLANAEGRLASPVVNVIAVRPGRQSDAIALVSHYDSPPESRGAADDGLGVAVCLEAGRVLAEKSDRRYTLVVALTDGEELGLMGARVLRSAPEFANVQAFLNFEAVGTTGPSRLFQSGPGNSWLAAAWAGAVPFPSGSSLFAEIYRRLPNDTDFSILKQGTPGLDFAPTGNTFAYHTPLDTPAHLDSTTLAHLGENVVRLIDALDAVDIRQRTDDSGTFFDLLGRVAVSYSSGRTRVLAVVVFVLGLLAAYKAYRAAREEVGFVRVSVTAAWGLVGLVAEFGALLVACALLRGVTGLEQPWYGQVTVFPVYLVTVALGALWVLVLVSRSLPVTVRPSGHPACVWMLTLPLWSGALAFLQRTAPGTGYLFAFPLAAAAILILALPMRNATVARLVSLAVGVVAGVLWAPLWGPLLEFAVGTFGAQPIVAPVWLYPAVVMVAGLTVVPAFEAVTLGRERRVLPASVVTSLLLLAVVASAWVMVVEPAYKRDSPERRRLRYVQDMLQQKAIWEVGTHELTEAPAGTAHGAPTGWEADDQPPALSVRLPRIAGPFRYRARGAGLVAPPIEVRSSTEPIEGSTDAWLATTAVAQLEGTGVAFVLPWGVTPIASNLPGFVADGRWQAVLLPAPPGGATLRVRLSQESLARLFDARVAAIVYGVPGGVGWQRLPPWLPKDTVAWRADSYFIVPWPAPVLATPAPLDTVKTP